MTLPVDGLTSSTRKESVYDQEVDEHLVAPGVCVRFSVHLLHVLPDGIGVRGVRLHRQLSLPFALGRKVADALPASDREL